MLVLRVDKDTHRVLSRFPRNPRVWSRLGITLDEDTTVIVRPKGVVCVTFP